MFEVADRDRLRAWLVGAARADPEVDAAALVGSAARGAEDRWSDIDLALQLTAGAEPGRVADRWTVRLRAEQPVVDHLDVHAAGALYRVFLLASTLQVDLSFWPPGRLVTGGAPVRLLFGELDAASTAVPEEGPAEALDHLRTAWLHALHVRSALARGRSWQALGLLEGLRHALVALYCRRHGLTAVHGREVDALPPDLRAGLAATLVGTTDAAALHRAFGTLVGALLSEADRQALPVPAGLAAALDELVATATPGAALPPPPASARVGPCR